MFLAAAAQAQLYVVNHGNGTIGEYSLSGETINPALISGLRSPTGLAIADGYLYVVQFNGVIKKYTTSGALVNPALVAGLYGPWGVAVSGDYLYVANGGGESSTIGKYTTSGATVNPALIQGLGNPTGLEVEGEYLYVSEWHTGRIGKYTVDGVTVDASLISGLTYPGGLALDGKGSLFVSSLEGGVQRYTTAGAGGETVIPGTYNSGIGLAFDGVGSLYYANNFGGAGGNRIGQYTTSGQVVNEALITGLANPVEIAVIPPSVPTNHPPVASAGPDQSIECMGGTTLVTLNGSGSSDEDGDALTYLWSVAGAQLGFGEVLAVNLTTGAHWVRLTVIDPSGSSAEDTVLITIQDTTPPQLGNLAVTPQVLWPPDHKMIPVTIHVNVADACDPGATARIVSVLSNEPLDRRTDWEITGALTLNLRAERLGTGRGRTYRIIVEAVDAGGNLSTGSVTVSVPHHWRPKALDVPLTRTVDRVELKPPSSGPISLTNAAPPRPAPLYRFLP